jgi:hypothetical protein
VREPVQRPWGRMSLGDGGAARRTCGWSRGNEGDRVGREVERGQAGGAGPCGLQGGLGLCA